jgi:hypothetical protein
MDSHEKWQSGQYAKGGKAVRQGQKRRTQGEGREKRQFFRIVYPLTLAPRTSNGEVRVINLSRQGILFRWEGWEPARLALGSIVNLRVRFHDGETLNLAVNITRCQSDVHSRQTVYAGILRPALSSARISKEEAYLLRHVPDFCRVAWYPVDRLPDD